MFVFRNTFEKRDGLVFSVPSDPTNKQELFSAYGAGLNAPNGYFGANWDAFQDMLLGLDWVREYKVFLRHSALPNLSDKDLSIYLNVLRTSARDWNSPKTIELKEQFPDFVAHELIIEFQSDLDAKVTSLLSTSDL